MKYVGKIYQITSIYIYIYIYLPRVSVSPHKLHTNAAIQIIVHSSIILSAWRSVAVQSVPIYIMRMAVMRRLLVHGSAAVVVIIAKRSSYS